MSGVGRPHNSYPSNVIVALELLYTPYCPLDALALKVQRAMAAEYKSWCSGDDTIAQRNLPGQTQI